MCSSAHTVGVLVVTQVGQIFWWDEAMKVLITDRYHMLSAVPRPSVIVLKSITSDELRALLSNGTLLATVFDDPHMSKQIAHYHKGMQPKSNVVSPAWLNPGDCLIVVERQSPIDFLFYQLEITC